MIPRFRISIKGKLLDFIKYWTNFLTISQHQITLGDNRIFCIVCTRLQVLQITTNKSEETSQSESNFRENTSKEIRKPEI